MTNVSKVKRGQVTYDAEGNDNPKSQYFSRRIHWPGNALSGVTVGRGYDIGNRSKANVLTTLKIAGVPLASAKLIASGAGVKGNKARDFVKKNKDLIGTISHAAQSKLFELIYPEYERRAKSNYDKWTASQPKRVLWKDLDPPIRDILVDFVYQGFTKGPRPMKAAMNNSYDELIKYIKSSATMNRYEAGRRRASYLKKHQAVKKAIGIGPLL